MDKIKKYQLALKTFELIKEYAEQRMDYSLLMNSYNGVVEEYELDLPRVQWVDIDKFNLITE